MKLKILVVAVVFFTSGFYIYNRGLEAGEQRYKQSRRMYLALKSAYNYGYMDAKNGSPKSWDGPEAFCSDCVVSPICVANVTEEDIQFVAAQSDITVTGLPHNPRWITLAGKECN